MHATHNIFLRLYSTILLNVTSVNSNTGLKTDLSGTRGGILGGLRGDASDDLTGRRGGGGLSAMSL